VAGSHSAVSNPFMMPLQGWKQDRLQVSAQCAASQQVKWYVPAQNAEEQTSRHSY
jgi:hypothetical protein